MDIDDIGDLALAEFINWFKANDGYLDTESTRFKTFPMSEGGRGMCAVKDIQA
ncbi:hypothetical protein APHAL10511_003628 [Amanita phalloides]|nr:hypothetical protein APHAL10511_003628 [Amanita phalloides]